MTITTKFVDLTDQIKNLKGMVITFHPESVFNLYLGLTYFTRHFPNPKDQAFKDCMNILHHIDQNQPEVRQLAEQFFAIVDKQLSVDAGVNN